MIQYSPCATGCAIQTEAGPKVCKRCFKAEKTEVESPQEQYGRKMKEDRDFIAMAEEGRERIMARLEMLSPHNHLLVMSYFGGEYTSRGYPPPFTPMGRALGIVLLAEALVVMVPDDEKPWVVDGKVIDITDEEAAAAIAAGEEKS